MFPLASAPFLNAKRRGGFRQGRPLPKPVCPLCVLHGVKDPDRITSTLPCQTDGPGEETLDALRERIMTKGLCAADFRTLIGATNPAEAAPGTIRADFAESIAANAVHGSDSDENAAIEGAFFFSTRELA